MINVIPYLTESFSKRRWRIPINSAIFLLLFLFTHIFAQNREEITESDDYYFGTGISENAREARDRALSELTSQIAVNVQSSFVSNIVENKNSLTENVESVLKTYSSAALRNVHAQTEVLPNGSFEVFCFLEKKEVEKIFNERKNLIAAMVLKAENYINENNISFALKQLYFAQILIKSLPEENVVYREINYTLLIPNLINQTLLKTAFHYTGDVEITPKERIIHLRAFYNDQPVSLIDFSFWDGVNQVEVQGRDGLADFTLFGASTAFEDIKLNIKYRFYESRKEYSAVADLWNLVDRPDFDSDKTIIFAKPGPLPVAQLKLPEAKIQAVGCSENIKLTFRTEKAPRLDIINQTCAFIEAIRRKSIDHLPKNMAEDLFLKDKIDNYLKNNHPRFKDSKFLALIDSTDVGYELRRLPVSHNYPSIPRQTTEYLVLDFDIEGRLIDFNTTITEYLYHRFVEESQFGNDWGNRLSIIKFLERYRMAYLTRDIKTIGFMFAEEALIIIGREIKKKPMLKDMVKYQKLGKEPDYNYIRLSKQEYLLRQHKVFNSQQDIFLNFGSFDIIRKNDMPNIYGVEMRQSYVSTSYADEGYLFLLIDFSEKDPLIYVRAWQPEAWEGDELVKTANFKIYK